MGQDLDNLSRYLADNLKMLCACNYGIVLVSG